MTKKSKLNILWTNDNLITSEKMVFMYGINTKKKKLWDDVTIILWGSTTKLASENIKIQELIKEAKNEGVHISACKACAEQLGVLESLAGQGIELIYWAEPLTNILKNDEKLLTI